MQMNKKRRGLTYIEVIFATLLSAIVLLALAQLAGLNTQLIATAKEYEMKQSFIRKELFSDVKNADNIVSIDNTTMIINKGIKAITWQIGDGWISRDNVRLSACTTGNFELINNTVVVVLKNKEYELVLRALWREN